jgi:succinate dehydrogenase hydrophobic anchor subunit
MEQKDVSKNDLPEWASVLISGVVLVALLAVGLYVLLPIETLVLMVVPSQTPANLTSFILFVAMMVFLVVAWIVVEIIIIAIAAILRQVKRSAFERYRAFFRKRGTFMFGIVQAVLK